MWGCGSDMPAPCYSNMEPLKQLLQVTRKLQNHKVVMDVSKLNALKFKYPVIFSPPHLKRPLQGAE